MRYPRLDELRGIAILLVMLFHFALVGGFSTAPVVQAIALGGWTGVDLFFAISGFLLTASLLERKVDARAVRRFYWRRVLRIIPLYYAFVAFVALYALGTSKPWPTMAEDIVYMLTFTMNAPSALESRFLPFHINPVWSLAIEVQLYVILPFIIMSGRATPIFIAFIALSLIIRVIASYTGDLGFAYFATPARLDAFALGALVALQRKRVSPALFGFALVGLSIIIDGGLYVDKPFSLSFGLFGAALVYARLVSLAAVNVGVTNAPLAYVGKVSYAIYLFHYPILWKVKDALEARGVALGENLAVDGAAFLAWSVGCVALATVSFYGFEQWFLRKRLNLQPAFSEVSAHPVVDSSVPHRGHP